MFFSQQVRKRKHLFVFRTGQPLAGIVHVRIFRVCLRFVYAYMFGCVLSYLFSSRQRAFTAGNAIACENEHDFFSIILLTMNRTSAVARVLEDIKNSEFCGDSIRLEVHVDNGVNSMETINFVKNFTLPGIEKVVKVNPDPLGLAGAWFAAFNPVLSNERFIILEDDIRLSPLWYVWLKRSWVVYGDTDGLAGISLQGQTLIPYGPSVKRRIRYRSQPFLYSLVGSIGFSPHPMVWRDFLHWQESLDPTWHSVVVPGLVTSDWWVQNGSRDMWTQYFIFYSLKINLYTLYVTEKVSEALAVHCRLHGVHFKEDAGADFEAARALPKQFPKKLVRFGWGGERVDGNKESRSGRYLQQALLLHAAKQIMHENSFAYLLFLNRGFIHHTMNWICNMERIDRQVLKYTVFISSDFYTTRELLRFRPMLFIFTRPTDLTETASFGTYNYYKLVHKRIDVQNMLLQEGVNIQIIESDHIWNRSLNADLRQLFVNRSIIAGDESAFTGQQTKKICGGFYGISSSNSTRNFFQNYYDRYSRYLHKFHGHASQRTGRIKGFEDDQMLLTRLVRDSSIDIHWLDPCLYANGNWFVNDKFKKTCPVPSILHNNFIVGNNLKAKRARFENMWYLDDNTCRLIEK